MTNKNSNKKYSFIFLLNLGLTFTLVGIILSFFIFSYERSDKDSGFLAYAKNDRRGEASDSLKAALEVQNSIRSIVDKNMPGVVNISSEIEPTARQSQQDRYYEDFFKHFFGEQTPQQSRRPQQSLGSGFIVDKEGYILSNYHVVKGASKISVMLYGDDKEYPAELVGHDEGYDLALLKIESNEDFPYVEIGDSDIIEPGEFAVAIGNPYGLNNTVTFGIVSAKGRSDVGANRYQRYIQTDVAINPGNSGGPLFNIYGEVIGINTMIYSTSGGSIGIGFATPINVATLVMPQLKETGRVTRGYIGLYPQDIDENLAVGLNLEQNSGVYISDVVPNSPASKAGLKEGDIITSIDGEDTLNAGNLFKIVSETPVGKTVKLTYIRNKRTLSTKITMEARPDDDESGIIERNSRQSRLEYAEEDWMGIEVSNVTSDLAKRLQIRENEKGVIVINIAQSSKAYREGLKPGDVIKAINGVSISNIVDYSNFVRKNNNVDEFTITIKRSKMTYVIIIK